MTNATRETLIQDLVGDLEPVARPGDTRRPLGLWLAVALPYGVAIVLATGDLREGALAALAASPPFALEIGAALAAVVLLARAALRSGIPGAPRVAWLMPAGLALGVWLAFYVVAIVPGVDYEPPSMLGKREHCFWETLLYGAPTFALLLSYARRLWPAAPRATAALAGAAAAAIPGSLMQLACMYDPAHALMYHLSPIALYAALGAALGRVALRRPPARRRPRDVTAH